VNLSFSDPSHQSYVSVSGRGVIVQDKAKAKELWHAYLKAWLVFVQMIFRFIFLFFLL